MTENLETNKEIITLNLKTLKKKEIADAKYAAKKAAEEKKADDAYKKQWLTPAQRTSCPCGGSYWTKQFSKGNLKTQMHINFLLTQKYKL